MSRLTMRRMQDNIDADKIGRTGLANDQCHKRNILERELSATGNEAIITVLTHQDRKKCTRRTAAKGHLPKPMQASKSSGKPRRKDFKTPEGFDECGKHSGRSYSSRRAESMEEKQKGFPEVMRHPTTIHNMILPLTGDASAATDVCRQRMRTAFSNFSNGSQISGAFQIVMKTAAYLATIFPAEELPSCLDPVGRPDEVFALLHWHGIIADPRLTKQEIKHIVKGAYPGCRRVCVAKVQPTRINNKGEITHGAQGFLEYALLNKTEVEFTNREQTKEALIGYAQLGPTWNRRNRGFSMGKSLSATGVQIDPGRIALFELMEQFEQINKDWKKLSLAERFVYVWLSGVFAIVCKPCLWLTIGNSIANHFLIFLSTIRNWSTDIPSKSSWFYGYLRSRLE